MSDQARFLSFVLFLVALPLTGASAQSLTTTFIGGNGQSGAMFDIKAINPGGVVVNDFDVHLNSGVGGQIEVYAVTGGGSFVGKESNPGAWTLLGTANVTSAGLGNPTNLGLHLGYVIPTQSVQGFYITLNAGTGFIYTNGTQQGLLYASNADLEFYEGAGISYPFGGLFTPRVWNGTIYYSTGSPQSDDLSLDSIDGIPDPSSCTPLSATQPVSFTVRNVGQSPIAPGTMFTAELSVDGAAPVAENFMTTATLNFSDTEQLTFNTTADISAIGAHTIDVTIFYPGDLDPSNDNGAVVVTSGGPTGGVISAFPYFENFDSASTLNQALLPIGWIQDPSDGGGSGGVNAAEWFIRQGPTNTTDTGPLADHTTGDPTGGYYAYVEDSDSNYASVNMLSPCIDLTGAPSNIAARFYLHSRNGLGPSGGNLSFFSLDVLDSSGVVIPDLIGPLGHVGTDWTEQFVDMAPFTGNVVQFRFRVSNDNNSFKHDVCIDDFLVGVSVSGDGQPGRPGLALLDLNAAVNPLPLQGGPASGDNGPFVATATVGGNLDFYFNGEPDQPYAWLAGALNPVSATYSGMIGQFDIGTVIDPVSGIPSDITTIGNGFAPYDVISALCRTGPAGDGSFSIVNYGLPSGFAVTFQAVMASTTNQGGAGTTFFGAISNAVQLTVQ